jgi:hypothetical protein
MADYLLHGPPLNAIVEVDGPRHKFVITGAALLRLRALSLQLLLLLLPLLL